MSILDAPARAHIERPKTCKAARVLAGLSNDDQAAVQAAIKDPAWSLTRIARAMTDNGAVISETALWKHTRQLCICTNTGERP